MVDVMVEGVIVGMLEGLMVGVVGDGRGDDGPTGQPPRLQGKTWSAAP